MDLTKKIAVAAGALTLGFAGAAAAATAVDSGPTKATDQVGIDLPDQAGELHATSEDDATLEAADDVDAPESDAAGQGPVDNHGAEVSAVAHGDTVGRAHGEAVSTVARQGHGSDAPEVEGADDDEADEASASDAEEHADDAPDAGEAGEHGRP